MRLFPGSGHIYSIAALICLALMLMLQGCRDPREELVRYLNAAAEHWGFEGVVAVAVDGHEILSRGYGRANREIVTPNTPETKFFIGSITKQFTAAAILKLQEQGLLNVSDPISKYLPDYPAEVASKITIEDLLTHTSGIPDYTLDPMILLRRTEWLEPDELIASFEQKLLEFKPGTQFSYSNSNYILLGSIIEAVSGQSYEAFLHNKLLKPAGMLSSGYGRREAGIPDRADGYTRIEGIGMVKALPISFSVLHTAGALYSTAEDMLKWDRALRSGKILSAASVKQMLTPHAGDYGYGWFIDYLFGRTHTYHGGFIDGFNTTFDRWIEDKLCVVVFSNEDNTPVKKMARGIAAIMFDEPYVFPIEKTPIELDSAAIAEYAGLYETSSGELRVVEVDSNALYSHIRGYPRERLFPQAVDTFFNDIDNTLLTAFDRSHDGKISGLTIVDDYYSTMAQRLPDDSEIELQSESPPVMNVSCEKYVGTYLLAGDQGDQPEVSIAVTCVDSQMVVVVGDFESIDLLPVSSNTFVHKEGDFALIFHSDPDGETTGCTLKWGRGETRAKKVR